jgi:hypothetical protein
VELRSPAKEGSDVILTSYYSCHQSCYSPEGNYNTCCCSAGAYSRIPGAPTSVPNDVAIHDEHNCPAAVFRFVGADCAHKMTGPLCQGSGIRPNITGGPPSMLGDGPCELPFLEWQVVALMQCLMQCQYLSKFQPNCSQ